MTRSRTARFTALACLVALGAPSFVGMAPLPPRTPKVSRNAGETNFEIIDEVLKSIPNLNVQVESTDPKYLRWKVAWNPPDDGGATLQFGYQVMLQKTDQNKDYFSLQSAFKRPPSMQPGDALIFANQWNAAMPYAHIYVSNDSNLRLEMELDFNWLGDGKSSSVKEMIATFSDLILALAARCRNFPGSS